MSYDIDDLGDLETVMTMHCAAWTDTQREMLRNAAKSYVMRTASAREIALSVQAIAPGSTVGASWIAFATWLQRRAGRFGQLCRDTGTPPVRLADHDR